ncbi:hypothetical protein SBOR_3201 [Sclerotinia borealis F-4128]|uniref:Uncharacterized protein n=1 Tax=Sclerotinia borealis (strain F-4128) TaxID=1432307 RepID=W9CPB3_SCLBF|nr:hypothetical protein SBOR_3201 [Sclerotinia borealis F-4128]
MKLNTFARLVALATTISAALQPFTSQIKIIAWAGIAFPDQVRADNDHADPFAGVTAHFVVPAPQDKNPGRVYAWVGIDGNVFGKSDRVIRTGVDIETLVNDLTLAISLHSTMDSANAIITNANGGLTLMQTFDASKVLHKATGKTAQFIIERVETQITDTDTSLTYAPLLNFGTVQFTKCVATTFGYQSVDLSGGLDGSRKVAVYPLTMYLRDDVYPLGELAFGKKTGELTTEIVWRGAGTNG